MIGQGDQLDGKVINNILISRQSLVEGSIAFFADFETDQTGGIYLAHLPESRVGDFDMNGLYDRSDIDLLTGFAANGLYDELYDLNLDLVVDEADRTYWITELANTFFGDANLDGLFTTRDLVLVLQAGEYEDGLVGNSTWATGDWDGRAEFSTSDLVAAFREGGFELGPKGPIVVVPEPKQHLRTLAFIVALFMAGSLPRLRTGSGQAPLGS